ncbi:MAG: dihydrodipicolinate synthase family protein, partial [Planctomycetota bacterium]
ASECPRVIGIKDSSGDLPNMMRMISQVRPIRDDFTFLTGWDAALVPMLVAGADGGTNATSGVVPELTREIHRSVVAGRIEYAMKLQYQLLPLFDAMVSLGEFPEGFRAGARSRGWDLGPGRVPVSTQQRNLIQRAQAEIDTLLAQLIQDDGDALASTDAYDVVQRVVQRVLSQLHS